MYKIPWCVVLAAINDQPRLDRKRKDGDEIASEKEAKKFFNLQ